MSAIFGYRRSYIGDIFGYCWAKLVLYLLFGYCRSYIGAIFGCLDAVEGDFTALLALCLLYAIGENRGNVTQCNCYLHITCSVCDGATQY